MKEWAGPRPFAIGTCGHSRTSVKLQKFILTISLDKTWYISLTKGAASGDRNHPLRLAFINTNVFPLSHP